ncbi:hypothetical protein OIU34_20835 [Pararhizobium sp. BT-229]|uniref:hypothetical protein n=1 Tax=Pararhizobium sp. BT-229 TaxID=2986923 RepID=UPI0021F77CE1|nr:hypothetical protein [Pararhizobium sp. BT-229]MCV9964337.1 hypothetical protein [Pararhizobium sp. BT-229]
MAERYFGDLTGYASAEQRLFAECVERASHGADLHFPLRIKTEVNVPFLPQDGRGPMIVGGAINIDMPLPIKAVTDTLVIRTWSVKDGDASSAERKEIPVFVSDEYSMGIERSRSAGMAIPDYIRAIAARWLETDIEAALRATAQDRINLREVAADVEDDLLRITVHVDDAGTAILAKKQEVPRFILVADPIAGPKHHYGLALATAGNTGWMYGWVEEFLSFPLGDYRQADAVRNALVAEHCPEHGDFGYDWTDARLFDGRDFVDHHEGLIQLANSENDLASAVFEFGKELAHALPSGSKARRDILAAVRQSPDETDVLEACGLAQDEHPDAYKAFLETAGWDYRFDPFDVVGMKRRYAMGLPLHDAPASSNRTPGF